MTNSTNLLVYAVSALMLATGGIYLHEAYLESQEFNTEFTAQVETMFFTTAGILYVPFGIWMINNRLASKAPYIISIVGSVSLIGLYVASRTINLPVVGLQEDIGMTDLASKVLQTGINCNLRNSSCQVQKKSSYQNRTQSLEHTFNHGLVTYYGPVKRYNLGRIWILYTFKYWGD